MKRLLLALLLLVKTVVAGAQMDIARIDIVAPADNTAAVDVATKVQHALQQAQLGIKASVHDTAKYQNNNSANTLVVTVNDQSLIWLSEHNNVFAGAIAFNITSASFAAWNKSKADTSKTNVTALYRDQPLLRQLQLSKLLIPNLQRVVVLRNVAEPLPSAEILQRQSRVSIDEIHIEKQAEWPKLLSQALRENDVLLSIDDPSIYNSDTIRSILLTAYRHGKGVIGPSRAFVNAGSLASCYTTSEQYLQQLVAMVTVALREQRLPLPQYPNKFSVIVNRQVANSLNLSIPDENTLSARLQDLKGECDDGC